MTEDLSQQEQMALTYLRDGAVTDTGSVADVCHLSTEAARRMLLKLKKMGIVDHVEDVGAQRQRNTLWWEITDKGKEVIDARFFDRTEGFPRLVS